MTVFLLSQSLDSQRLGETVTLIRDSPALICGVLAQPFPAPLLAVFTLNPLLLFHHSQNNGIKGTGRE